MTDQKLTAFKILTEMVMEKNQENMLRMFNKPLVFFYKDKDNNDVINSQNGFIVKKTNGDYTDFYLISSLIDNIQNKILMKNKDTEFKSISYSETFNIMIIDLSEHRDLVDDNSYFDSSDFCNFKKGLDIGNYYFIDTQLNMKMEGNINIRKIYDNTNNKIYHKIYSSIDLPNGLPITDRNNCLIGTNIGDRVITSKIINIIIDKYEKVRDRGDLNKLINLVIKTDFKVKTRLQSVSEEMMSGVKGEIVINDVWNGESYDARKDDIITSVNDVKLNNDNLLEMILLNSNSDNIKYTITNLKNEKKVFNTSKG